MTNYILQTSETYQNFAGILANFASKFVHITYFQPVLEPFSLNSHSF